MIESPLLLTEFTVNLRRVLPEMRNFVVPKLPPKYDRVIQMYLDNRVGRAGWMVAPLELSVRGICVARACGYAWLAGGLLAGEFWRAEPVDAVNARIAAAAQPRPLPGERP